MINNHVIKQKNRLIYKKQKTVAETVACGIVKSINEGFTTIEVTGSKLLSLIPKGEYNIDNQGLNICGSEEVYKMQLAMFSD
jgi:hypothetical protein